MSGSSNRSSRSSFDSRGGPAGEVGGVVKGFDWDDDLDGVDVAFNGLE